ncbi:MAG: hypothetical protein FWD61_17750 [Phycisphaerales bacterium]|nr:hypothetical protein [Phycisphaerales bacterium]
MANPSNNDAALEQAICKLLLEIPEAWAEYDQNVLTAPQQEALLLLMAAGMVERRSSFRIRMFGHPEAAEATYTGTGEYGEEEAFEKVAASMWEKWGPVFEKRREGPTKGAPAFHCESIGSKQWRLTSNGIKSRNTLETNTNVVLDYVLKRGDFDGQRRQTPSGRIVHRLPVPGKVAFEKIGIVNVDAVKTTPADVNVVNPDAIGKAVAAALDEKFAAMQVKGITTTTVPALATPVTKHSHGALHPTSQELLEFRDETLKAAEIAYGILLDCSLVLAQVSVEEGRVVVAIGKTKKVAITSEIVIRTGLKLRAVYEHILRGRDISASLQTKEQLLDFVETAIPPGSVTCGKIVARSAHRLVDDIVFRLGWNMATVIHAEDWLQRLSDLETREFDDPDEALRELREQAKEEQKKLDMSRDLKSLLDDLDLIRTTIRNEYSIALQALKVDRTAAPSTTATPSADLTPEPLSPPASQKTKKKKQTTKRRKTGTARPLTTRQQQAVELYAKRNGQITKIANEMGIKPSTAQQHVDAAKKKLESLQRSGASVTTRGLSHDKRGQADVVDEED